MLPGEAAAASISCSLGVWGLGFRGSLFGVTGFTGFIGSIRFVGVGFGVLRLLFRIWGIVFGVWGLEV